MFLLILLFLSLFSAFYLLFCGAARLPTIGTTLATLRIAHPKAKKGNPIHMLVMSLSMRLAKYIRLNEEKKSDLSAQLRLTGSGLTPETHVARIAVNFVLWLALAAVLFAVSPILGLLVVGLDIYLLFQDITALGKGAKAAREKIEADLPRLAATLAQELQSNRDVIGILTAFLPSAAPEFRSELQMTLADMRSGSPEKALIRMDKRVGSLMLSEIVRGLLMVLQGDNGVQYFEMLEHDFKQTEIQNLSLIAEKRPGKIQTYSFLMFLCLMLTILGALLLYAVSKTQGLGLI